MKASCSYHFLPFLSNAEKKKRIYTYIYLYIFFYISIHKTEAYFVAGLEQNDYARCTAINNLSYRFLTMNDAFFFHLFSSLSLPLFQWFERLARKNVSINAIWFFSRWGHSVVSSFFVSSSHCFRSLWQRNYALIQSYRRSNVPLVLQIDPLIARKCNLVKCLLFLDFRF